VENFYQDLELWVPYYRLKEEGGRYGRAGERDLYLSALWC
jgi:hypothetical protein